MPKKDKKVVLITAGGSGMGAAIARRLAAEDYRVAILSSSGRGEALARELGGVGVTGSNREVADLERLVARARVPGTSSRDPKDAHQPRRGRPPATGRHLTRNRRPGPAAFPRRP